MDGHKDRQQTEVATKSRVSVEYLRSVIDKKNVPEARLQLLVQFVEQKVDHRTLCRLKTHIFDLHPDKEEIPVAEWKKESHRCLNIYPEAVEEKLLEEISVDGNVSRKHFQELLDTYQYLPIKIKRDKNKSEQVYFVLNSNKRGAYQSKEEILRSLKEDNDRKGIAKIMVLIAIKIEEKFHNLNKAFLSFDLDGDQGIQRNEFHKGIENLRVKLPKAEVDKVFDHMDQDGDGKLNYHEFCGFSEEKRRNIDPFDQEDNQERLAQSMGLNNRSLMALQKNPYGNINPSELSGSASTKVKYTDLESQAAMMMIINNGQVNRMRKGSIPLSVKNNKDFTFGMRSDVMSGSDQKSHQSTPGKFQNPGAGSSMQQIISHTDNLKESLQRKISIK